MKRTLLLSLILVANVLTIKDAEAVDWKKVKQYSITALKLSCAVAAVTAIGYLIVQNKKVYQKSFDCQKEALNIFETTLQQYDLTQEEFQQAKIDFVKMLADCVSMQGR